MLNDEIELKTGDYINTVIYPYFLENFDKEKFYFSSVESYVYSKKNSNVLLKYEEKLPHITKAVLNGKVDDTYNNFYQIIKNGMQSKQEMIIYRGICCDLKLNVGEIFDHKTFIWGSFHESYARKFMYDTSKCYDAKDFQRVDYSKKGVLLKIKVPIGIPYFERIVPIDFAPHEPKSEIILLPSQLQVDKIEGDIIHLTVV